MRTSVIETGDGVEDITVGTTPAEALVLQADHTTLNVFGVDNVTDVKVYNVAGVLVAHSNADTVNISALAPGIYIATVNNSASAKFMKK